MYLVGRNHVISNRSLIDTMKCFHALGYRGMELSLVRGKDPKGQADALAWDYMDDYVIDKVNETVRELDFEISAVSAHANYVLFDSNFEAEKKLICCAPKYGTDVCIVSTYAPYSLRETHEKELFEQLVNRTKELCSIAEAHNVRLAIEIEPNQLIHNMKTFYELADAVRSDALKINFDVGHLYLSEGNLIPLIDEIRDFIVFSHIDNMVQGEHCHKLPWEGDIDLHAVYQHLKDTCYDGAVALDLYLQDYEAVSPACIDYIEREIFGPINRKIV